jgi:hypothetical protein
LPAWARLGAGACATPDGGATIAARPGFTPDFSTSTFQETAMRSLLLLFLGIPIPIIILIALFVR